jgi:hypothetical protein
MGYGFALLLFVLLLALLGMTRWDVLRARWTELFAPPQALADPPVIDKVPSAPRHLHDDQLQHQAPAHRPPVHRSGRRG